MRTCTVSDLNATIERLRAGVPGSRFETVDFRSEGGAVRSSSDVAKTSPARDDDDDDDMAAAIERSHLDEPEPAVTSHAWDMSESSPC